MFSFIYYFLIFTAAIFIAFYIPGNLLLKNQKLTYMQKTSLSLTLGLVIWALLGFLFGYLGVRYLTYFYLLCTLYIWAKDVKLKNLYNIKWKEIFFKIDPVTLLIITSGIVIHLSSVWYIGHTTKDGLLFCCRGVPDAIYHLSLTNQITQNFPPFEPGMSGIVVQNYHYLSNLAIADIIRIFHLPLASTQFQYFSIFLSTLLGMSILTLTQTLNVKNLFSRFLAIFVYGSGDILYLLLFLRGKGLNFNVTIIDDATKLLAGTPRAFSVVILFSAFSLLILWTKHKKMYMGILMALIMGSLIGFKVYTGIFALSGLFFLTIFFFVNKKFNMMIPPIVAALISTLLYFPINKNAGGLIFTGTWRLENFAVHPDLALSKLEFMRLAYVQSHSLVQVVVLEIIFAVIFVIFLFGTVTLGLFQNKKSLKLMPIEFNIFLISAVIISTILGFFFVQKTGGANTTQFIISVFIFMSIYSSLFLYYWIGKIPKKFAILATIIIVGLTIPRAFHEGGQNINNIIKNKGLIVDNSKLAAIDYIKKTQNESQIMLDSDNTEEESLLYLSFLTNKPLFLAGSGVLRDHGVDITNRKNIVKRIMEDKNSTSVKDLLKVNKISYIYLPSNKKLNIPTDINVRNVFNNESISIYQVN